MGIISSSFFFFSSSSLAFIASSSSSFCLLLPLDLPFYSSSIVTLFPFDLLFSSVFYPLAALDLPLYSGVSLLSVFLFLFLASPPSESSSCPVIRDLTRNFSLSCNLLFNSSYSCFFLLMI